MIMLDVVNAITNSIVKNNDLDIIRTYNELGSNSPKFEIIKELINLCKQQKSDLIQYRGLIILSRLLNESTRTLSPNDRNDYNTIFERCRNLLQMREITNESDPSIVRIIKQLTTKMKNKANCHLKNAIITSCFFPDIDLSATKGSRSLFRNFSIRTLAPVRLDLGMGGISDIPPYSLERYGNCINVPICLNAKYPLEVVVDILPQRVFQFVSKDFKVKETYSNISDIDDQITALKFHKAVLFFFYQAYSKP